MRMAIQKMMLSLVLLLTMVSPLASVALSTQSLTSANTRFGHNLLKAVGAKYDNLVFSPYSIHSALTMTSNGANGETLQEMRTTLEIADLTEDAVNEAYTDLILSFNDTGAVDLLTGNAIFLNPQFTIVQTFQDLVIDQYFAMADTLDFSAPEGAEAKINDYVAEQTNDMIQNLLSKGSLEEDSTKLVLVNTIFFNGSWAKKFDKTDTIERDFHVSSTEKLKVDMMMQEQFFHMKFEDDYKSLKLPFVGDRYALYIVVPTDNTGHVTNLSCMSPDGYFTGLSLTEAKIYVPKFEINFKKSLPDVLKELGMGKAFTNGADLSRISPNSKISEVVHQAVIEVTESGTTAAAATAIGISLTSIQLPKDLPEFRADRPFLFYLRDDLHKEILFQGKFSRPMADPTVLVEEVQGPAPACQGLAPVQSLTLANTRFGDSVLKTVGPKYDNLVFSPYSIHSALTMTANGALGETLQEMRTTLETADLSEPAVNQAYMELIISFNDTGAVDVLTGNAIFQNPQYSIKDEFKTLVMDKYFAIAEMLNFSAPEGPEAMVNDYVAEKTNDMIQNLFAKNSLRPSTKLVLVNTIFFNGSWTKPFEETSTTKKDFRVSSTERVQIDMMMQVETFQMKYEDDYKSLRLPFKGDRFALYIVVPNNTDHVINLSCLPSNAPGDYFTGLSLTEAKIYVPKFKINFKKSLPDILKELGMRKAFTAAADLSRISPGSMISEVLHQAVIEVIESGTTAAAATAVVIVESSAPILPENLPEFRVDQPFLFYLRDDLHKEILFQGKFSRPMDDPDSFVEEVQRTLPGCGVSGTGPQDGGVGDGAATFGLALFGWMLCFLQTLFHIRRIIN